MSFNFSILPPIKTSNQPSASTGTRRQGFGSGSPWTRTSPFEFPSSAPESGGSLSKQGSAENKIECARDLKTSQHELFNRDKYSDLTVKCKSRNWKCHRAILCPRCPFFEAACGGQFTEASTRELDLSDDDETALEVMLQYLYTYEIPNPGLATATYYQLLIVGDKYELTELRDVAVENLSREISFLTQNDAAWVAEWYPQISQLQQKGTEQLEEQLATVIARLARELIKSTAIRELIASDGALAVTLVEKLTNPGMLTTPASRTTSPTVKFTRPPAAPQFTF